jgi:hypothetical protein
MHKLTRGIMVPTSIDQRTSFTLARTETYIYNAVVSVMKSECFKLADFDDAEKSHACYIATIYTGVMRLITGSKKPLRKYIPETLLLDIHRIDHMQREFLKFVMTISILALVNTKLKTWTFSNSGTYMIVFNKIVAALEKDVTTMDIELVVDTTDKVLQSTCQATTVEFKEFRDIMHACITRGVIMCTVAKRLRSFINDAISLSRRFNVFGSLPSVRTALDNHEVPAVAIILHTGLRRYVKAIQYFVAVNSKVHCVRYRQFIAHAQTRITDEFAKFQKPAQCLVAGFDGQVSRRKN